MIPDIKLNGESVKQMGWIRENVSFDLPQSQSDTIIVPGRNSPIRYTEALGRVSYKPRKFSLTFSMLGSRKRFNDMITAMINKYSGQLVKVVTSEDPNLYLLGTLELSSDYDPIASVGKLIIRSEDADSYRYHCDETVINLTGSGNVIIENDFMPVVPRITTTSETSLSWSMGSDSFRKTLSAGEWTLPELELQAGSNSITISGSGTTTFKFREGCL